ncbi:12201_t:CDS:2 [Entrophospora sp. SA101]|nr:12201_t:CDS:2 [Entrophospora sp. SA101]
MVSERRFSQQSSQSSTSSIVRRMNTPIKNSPNLSIKEREALQRESIRGSENKIFFDLYLKISNAEKQNDNVRHELIRSYYYFGEELEKRLTQYKDLPEHKAQKKINNEVRDQLPKEISKPTIRKKTERARKVYDLFFRINDDKNQRMVYIQRIKTFTASSISNLSLDNIKYVASQVRKDTGT